MTALLHSAKARAVDPAARTRRWLILAAAVSIALHVAVGAAVVDRPLGRFDPSMLESTQSVYRVRRAKMDLVLERELPGDNAQSLENPADELAQLSQALLAATPTPVPEDDPLLVIRDLPEARPLTDDPGQSAAPQLGDAAAAALLRGADVTLPGIGAGVDGGASPGIGVGIGSGESAAALLAQGGFVAGRNPAPPAPPPGVVDDRPALSERRAGEVDLGGTSIDFAALAVARSIELEAPQHLDHDFVYRLYGLTPLKPLDDLPTRGYFQVDIEAQRSLRKLATMPKDVVFLIDVSGSIPQGWVDQIVTGVSDALGGLNDGDRFNIVFFAERTRMLREGGVLPATPLNIATAREFLRAGRSGGYTDVNRALSQLLVRDIEAERVYDLILITDGIPTRGVMDTRELINLITRDNDLAAGIYCVGVGRRQNREMLDFLSYRNKGFSVFIERENETAGAIRDLLSRLRYPIIKNVRVDAAGLDAPDELFPRNLPDIHQGQTLSLYGRFRVPAEFTMRLSGQNGGKPVDFTFTRNLEFAQSAPERLPYQWAFWKLHDLYDQLLIVTDAAAIRQRIEQIKREYGLKTVY